MKKPVLAATLVALALPLSTIAHAGPIESACMRSDRGGSRSLCGCIQQVADMTLKNGDQRRAAKFFSDPDEAQRVRMSTKDADNAFWGRYKNFGETAQAYCGG
ncbi:MAG: hypothetical protein DI533_05625 [Cereibacter sphaeroides]|uniref:Arginine transporter n=1 Tax=Cereibacter sphaeroides TaxID=1063 RepID=A0A2W5SL73_CERSP|nr:MAG: hypothetical protein DI533_05625 [Cereibacter sphaeroides]